MTTELLYVPARNVQRCQRCGGQMYKGFDDEFTCLHCGEVVYPPRPVARFPLDEAPSTGSGTRRTRGRPRREPAAQPGAA